MRLVSLARSRSDLFLFGDRLGVFFRLGLAFGDLGFGALQVHQIQGDVFPLASLDAVEVHAVGLHLVLADNVIAAILQVQLEVRRPGREDQQQKRQQVLAHISSDYCNAGRVSWGRLETCGGLATRQLRRLPTGAQLAKLPHIANSGQAHPS